MKIFLDDIRKPPNGWIQVYWPDEMINLLKTGFVEEISLDHYLGDDKRGTGYDVLLWIENAIVMKNFEPPKIKIHSANISARRRMELAVTNINKLRR